MRKKQQSFTLVEMLVAFSILTLVFLSLYGTFWSGVKIQKRSEKAESLIRQRVWVLDQIAKELEAMIPYDFSGSDESLRPFIGESSQIAFIVASEKGLKRVSYYLKKEEEVFVHQINVGETLEDNISFIQTQQTLQDQYIFVREEEPFVSFLRKDSFDQKEEILIKGIAAQGISFSFAFLQKEGQGIAIVWKEAWNENYIPAGVKLKINFAAEKGEEPFEIVKYIYIPTGFWGDDEV